MLRNVAKHTITILHPCMRREAPIPHTDANPDATPGYPVPLEHAIERDRAHQAEWAEQAELGSATQRERQSRGARVVRRVD